ncbi:methyl-accepting chemotaxis protein [Actinokineospora diospyrosa]|uniref:Methyl-accepting chemotaxis sensory transducer with Cache sensor n=1 Tax=Actinokineospora diospyrosa TaxID=103728 RepID=A0ABT1I9J4_9PSEU|nr:methyl-accepting chemotaxis protein [Actinokineospora diospyrosa]MCP2269310.1 methyl-accepting chemotaxis sensory transducer with Cache sensor [Actinokineospora diospyrosa]
MSSFRGRLLVVLVPVVVIGLAVLSAFVVLSATTLEEDAQRGHGRDVAESLARQVETQISAARAAERSIVAAGAAMPVESRPLLDEVVRGALATTPEIYDMYLCFDAPGDPRYPLSSVYQYLWVKDGSGTPVRQDLDDAANADAITYAWYTEPKRTGAESTVEPYYDENLKALMTSVTAPMVQNGRTIGVAGVDVTLDQLSKKVSAAKVSEHGYAVLLSRAGTLLAAPDASVVGSKTLEQAASESARDTAANLMRSVANGGSGTLDGKDPLSADAGDAVLTWSPVEGTGWTLATVTPMSDVLAPVSALRTKLIGFALGIALVLLATVWFTTRRLTARMPVLRTAALDIARGRLDVTLPRAGRDELGELSAAFGEMVTTLRGTAGHLRRIASGDLSAPIEPAGADDELGIALVEMQRGLTASVRAVVETAEALTGSAEALRSQADELRDSATVTHTQSAAASLGATEFSDSVAEIASTVSRGATLAIEAEQATATMTEQLHSLAGSSAAIAGVVDVITRIAAQTHLLALNATIEASRAGETGRGFAVVATEVKGLAESTTTATVSVTDRIAAIQSDVDGTVRVIEQIGTSIRDMAELQGTIVAAVEEQSAASHSVRESIGHVTNVAARTETNVQASLGLADDLATAVQRLEQVSRSFRLPN